MGATLRIPHIVGRRGFHNADNEKGGTHRLSIGRQSHSLAGQAMGFEMHCPFLVGYTGKEHGETDDSWSG